jgi:segregation and condensation protein A
MSVLAPTAPGATTGVVEASDSFLVQLEEFSGPFDVLLSLIAKHRLDVTALSLHQVTDDFLAYIKELGEKWTLDEATQFLVIAATLLDLKAARLLPGGEVEDEEDLAVLEARDLLVARLLQYRAFKQMSADFKYRLATAGRMHPRTVGLDPRFQGLLPEVVFGFGPDDFANLAARALEPKLPEVISVAHIHAARVSVREQAAIIVERLRRMGNATFKSLTRDCDTTLLVVARFLALLEIYRDGVVLFDQPTPLGDLHIRWVGDDKADFTREIDEFDSTVVDEDFSLAADGNAELTELADFDEDESDYEDDDLDAHTSSEETPSNEGENVTDE